MLIKTLILAVLVLTTLQSIAAVADVHLDHQSGAPSLDCNHDDNSRIDTQAPDLDLGNCHHCCHCQPAPAVAMVPINFDTDFGIAQSVTLSTYTSRLLKRQYRFLRPPRT
jgi:hypothetical protein